MLFIAIKEKKNCVGDVKMVHLKKLLQVYIGINILFSISFVSTCCKGGREGGDCVDGWMDSSTELKKNCSFVQEISFSFLNQHSLFYNNNDDKSFPNFKQPVHCCNHGDKGSKILKTNFGPNNNVFSLPSCSLPDNFTTFEAIPSVKKISLVEIYK